MIGLRYRRKAQDIGSSTYKYKEHFSLLPEDFPELSACLLCIGIIAIGNHMTIIYFCKCSQYIGVHTCVVVACKSATILAKAHI